MPLSVKTPSTITVKLRSRSNSDNATKVSTSANTKMFYMPNCLTSPKLNSMFLT